MDEYEYDEGSDLDNWETEQVFQDHEGDDDAPTEEDAIAERHNNAVFLDHFQTLLAAMERMGK